MLLTKALQRILTRAKVINTIIIDWYSDHDFGSEQVINKKC